GSDESPPAFPHFRRKASAGYSAEEPTARLRPNEVTASAHSRKRLVKRGAALENAAMNNAAYASSGDSPVSTTPAGEDNLQIEGFKGTPEEIERQWLEKVYKGRGDSMAQLTVRAVVMGSILGGVLSLTNLYIGLKAGWGFGVAITASILSYAIWSSLYGL